MHLTYLTANAAYVFTFGDQIIAMGDRGRFFGSRSDAVSAAAEQGLKVSRSGEVSVDLKPGGSVDYANGYVARSFRTVKPYYAEATGDSLSPEFGSFAEARDWLVSR